MVCFFKDENSKWRKFISYVFWNGETIQNSFRANTVSLRFAIYFWRNHLITSYFWSIQRKNGSNKSIFFVLFQSNKHSLNIYKDWTFFHRQKQQFLMKSATGRKHGFFWLLSYYVIHGIDVNMHDGFHLSSGKKWLPKQYNKRIFRRLL